MRKLLFLTFATCLLGAYSTADVSSTSTHHAPISEQQFYIDCQTLYPSQLRYSSKNVQQKIDELTKNQGAFYNSEKKTWELKHNAGTSAFALTEAIPVVKGPFGYVLVDGHHHLLASLQMEATTIPVKVIADFSTLSEDEFWQRLEKEGWAYLYSILGVHSLPPKDFKLLQDDPNRYFAAISARKCASDAKDSTSTGAEYPLWIKVGKDIPFIEFRIADALWKAGLEYDYAMGDTPPEAFMEEARRILLEAKIPGLRVVPQKTHYTHVNIDTAS